MMSVTPATPGFRIEMPDGHYEYIHTAEAVRLHDNLRDALRPARVELDDSALGAGPQFLMDASGRIRPGRPLESIMREAAGE